MSVENTALKIYRRIYLIRRCEERIRIEYPKDEMKTPVHLHIGAEAISASVLEALPSSTKLFGTYRNHALYLARTNDTDGFFAELYGRETGCAQGKAGSMHLAAPGQGLMLTSAVVATTIPVAVGAALAAQYQGQDFLTAVFFGDGALEEGAFWESLNFACLRKLKILFVCEDNDLAIHTHGRDRRGFKSIRQAVEGFVCRFADAKGYEPQAVYETAVRLSQEMQAGDGPAFMHCRYLRYLEHVGIQEDFQAGYRENPTEAERHQQDPLAHVQAWALSQNISQAQLNQIHEEIERQIDQSIQKARLAPLPDTGRLFEGI